MKTFQQIQKENDHSPAYIQPQLEVGREDDEHEKEANQVADKVLRMPEKEEEEGKMKESKPLLQKMKASRVLMKMRESPAAPKMPESGVKIRKQVLDNKKAAKDELIKKKYFEIVNKGESHYMEAIQYLVDTYKLDIGHAIISYDATITGAYAITDGDVGDKKVAVRIAPACFSKSEDFGVICRAIAHEIIHSKQKTVSLMSDHNEREFLAYYDTITRTDMPEIKDMVTLEFFIEKVVKYYNALSSIKKAEYASQKKKIDLIKTQHKF